MYKFSSNGPICQNKYCQNLHFLEISAKRKYQNIDELVDIYTILIWWAAVRLCLVDNRFYIMCYQIEKMIYLAEI